LEGVFKPFQPLIFQEFKDGIRKKGLARRGLFLNQGKNGSLGEKRIGRIGKEGGV